MDKEQLTDTFLDSRFFELISFGKVAFYDAIAGCRAASGFAVYNDVDECQMPLSTLLEYICSAIARSKGTRIIQMARLKDGSWKECIAIVFAERCCAEDYARAVGHDVIVELVPGGTVPHAVRS